uniref:Uncharacterized protein n=1 Tax=Piliocolobus tephrosceles TaxID=591936 RepID=A0A8C9HET9_9PRIM
MTLRSLLYSKNPGASGKGPDPQLAPEDEDPPAHLQASLPPAPLLGSRHTGRWWREPSTEPDSPSTSAGREMSEKLRVYTKSPVPCVLGRWLLMSRQTLHQVENHEDLHEGKTSPLTTIPGHSLLCCQPLSSNRSLNQCVCTPHPLTPGEAQTPVSPAHDFLGAASPSSTQNLAKLPWGWRGNEADAPPLSVPDHPPPGFLCAAHGCGPQGCPGSFAFVIPPSVFMAATLGQHSSRHGRQL